MSQTSFLTSLNHVLDCSCNYLTIHSHLLPAHVLFSALVLISSYYSFYALFASQFHPSLTIPFFSLPPSRTLTHSHPHFFSLLHPLSLTLNVSLICILLPFMKSRFIRIPHIITPCKSKLTLLSPSFSLFLVLPVNPTLLATPSLLIFFLIPAIHYSHFFTLFSLHYSSHPI